MRIRGFSAVSIALLFGLKSYAAVFLVTTEQDSTNSNSLRGAIIAANARGGNNTIILTKGTYQLTIAGADEDGSYSGDLDVTNGELTIIGHSSATINASGLGDRVFQVFSNAQLTLENVVVTGGTGVSTWIHWPDLNGEAGGAIFNDGVVTLVNCVLANNSSGSGYGGGASGGDGGFGGAIYNAGRLAIINCLISDNSCGSGVRGSTGGSGGGIANNGWAILLRCTITGNQSGDGGATLEGVTTGFKGGDGGDGGGLYNSGYISLDQCTISNNCSGSGHFGGIPALYSGTGGAGGDGGNGGAACNSGTFAACNCIICNNSSGNGGDGGGGGFNGGSAGNGGSGAGICNVGTALFAHCILSNNFCGNGGDGAGGDFTTVGTGGNGGSGGGILNLAEATNVVMFNNLVAFNSAALGGSGGTFFSSGNQGPSGANGVGPDLLGQFTSLGYNLIRESDGSSGLINGINNDIVGTIAAPANPIQFRSLRWQDSKCAHEFDSNGVKNGKVESGRFSLP